MNEKEWKENIEYYEKKIEEIDKDMRKLSYQKEEQIGHLYNSHKGLNNLIKVNRAKKNALADKDEGERKSE